MSVWLELGLIWVIAIPAISVLALSGATRLRRRAARTRHAPRLARVVDITPAAWPRDGGDDVVPAARAADGLT